MAVAIKTKFFGPSNVRGARIKATVMEANPATGRTESLTLSWDHAVGIWENHTAAAKALAAKLEWDGEWVSGGCGDGMVFIRRINDRGFTI